WVEGLNQDWCSSRQRYFGVPFPVWYPVDADGEPVFDQPIFAAADTLPIDPQYDCPPGFDEGSRDQPGGFTGDPDVMDTWATSSLTPQIQSHWGVDDARHEKLFPMDVRPQSHEIIRTWAFYTIVKAWMHSDEVPWHHVVISGWILDPDRKKMSKSKGNVVTPENLLDEWTSDGVRYWAARSRLGTDTAYDPSVFKVGKRLVNKVFNASRFVLMQLESGGGELPGIEHITEPLDLALVDRLRTTVTQATTAFEAFDYATALQAAEDDFWKFCDHYLELVKLRSYSEEDTAERRSAMAALTWGLRTFLKLLAPFLPYVTEEVWSWAFASKEGRDRSVHTSAWPTVEEVAAVDRPEYDGVFEAAVEMLATIRGTKTKAQKSLRWPVARLEITGPEADRNALQVALEDVLRAGHVDPEAVSISDGPSPEGTRFAVTVDLAETMPE
ncbi:MAG: class I tRNA ligase family protein, partial [Acidobacteriota bacterium]